MNIRRDSLLAIASCAMLMLTACSDFLETPSKTSIPAESAYSTAVQVDQNLTGVYGALKPFPAYYFVMSEGRSDNLFQTAEPKSNAVADCSQFNTVSLLNNSYVRDCWADHYTLVAAANALIDRMDEASDLSAETKIQYEAEARFLRALSYFDLVRFYGRIPISLHQMTVDEAFQLPQSEASEVYDQVIVPDLLYAVEHLTTTAADYQGTAHPERVKPDAAKALLGKVYMQMAGYPFNQTKTESQQQELKEKAKTLFADVLTRYADYWAKDINEWNGMWIHENDNKYHIFEIQYINEKNQGNPAASLAVPNKTKADYFCGSSLTNGSHLYVERSLQNYFLEENGIYDRINDSDTEIILTGSTDLRLYNTVNVARYYDEETDKWIGGPSENIKNNQFFSRFFEHKLKRDSLGYSDMDASIIDRTCWPLNWPVLRIEDVMLLYAEIVGNTPDGYKWLNMIRQRAGLTTLDGLTKDVFQKQVAFERRIELMGEGHRWFDQVRHNTFVDEIRSMMAYYRDTYAQTDNNYLIYANRVTQNSALYPIPLSQMRVREGLYQQNPGY